MKYYIVWNEAKTEGFITIEHQLAYEARKGSEDNCYREDGTPSLTAQGFCVDTINDNCTIQPVIWKPIV